MLIYFIKFKTPIKHTSSPKMHNEAFRYLGLDYAYLAFEVGNEGLEDAVKGLRAEIDDSVIFTNRTGMGMKPYVGQNLKANKILN